MKRIAAAAIAATMPLSVLTSPAHAAEDEKTSSEVYQHCRGLVGSANEKEKEELRQNGGSSNPDAVCIKSMLNSPTYRGGVIAVLVGVPLALVALLGAAAAAFGMIPGVSIPGAPAMPEIPKLPM